jgi:hypothetical protein
MVSCKAGLIAGPPDSFKAQKALERLEIRDLTRHEDTHRAQMRYR